MRVLFVMLLFTLILSAKSQESCYTVQLVSSYNSQKNLALLHSHEYPQECKLMEIGNSLTVRCGCFERYQEAQEQLKRYIQEYKIATVATTYKYRFDATAIERRVATATKKYNKKRVSKIDKKPRSKVDEELRLMLQVFLYKGDLKSAYKVASMGYKRYPRSYYWNRKMAEICKWTNRSARAMKHLRFIYNIKRDPKIEKELIDYGSRAYQYENIEPLVINRARANPSETNIDLMILVFKKIGSPEKVVSVLDEQYQHNPENTMFLKKALQLSLEMGDLELAKKYVQLLEDKKPYTKEEAALIARYYYVTHDIEKSYKSLLYAKESSYKELPSDANTTAAHSQKSPYVKYYELRSDLGWYLQKNSDAAKASKILMDIHKARLVDYERISFVYQESNPLLAMEATREAYKEHKLSYLFYSYANGAINMKNFAQLKALIATVDERSSPLAKESLYWVIKAQVYAHYKQHDLEEMALERARELEPENLQIRMEMLWFYMDTKDDAKLRELLLEMSEESALDASAYLPMASAYFELSEIDAASYYTQKLLSLEHPATKLLEFQFLQAYIYQIQGNEGAFKSYMQDIVKRLKAEAKENPHLKKENLYLSNYLRAAINVLSPDKFEKKLKKAKKHLSKKNYDEIAYSWAIKNNAKEKSLKIYHRMSKKALWVEFSNAIAFQNHTTIENLLDWYLPSLSMGDASQAAHKDGQVALAQTITFEGLRHNGKNKNAYVQHLDLSKERSDMFNLKSAYYYRDYLLQRYIRVDNKTYLQDGYSLFEGVHYYKNNTLDTTILRQVPPDKVRIHLGLKKRYNRGHLEARVAYHNDIENYFEYALAGEYRWSTDLHTSFDIGKNLDALETTQLLLGGKKDAGDIELTYDILNSTRLSFFYEYNQYYAQDGVDLGQGDYFRVNLIKTIRNGYPDLRIGLFYDRGLYDETRGSRGVIDSLQAKNYTVLPEDFYTLGCNISYGEANLGPYTRVWRPYFELYPYYNSATEQYTYGLEAGYGGKVWHQDHLRFGALYTESVNGTNETIFELYLNYQFMYHHP